MRDYEMTWADAKYGTVKVRHLSGKCPWVVIHNGREIYNCAYGPDADREYNRLVGIFSRKILEAKYGYRFGGAYV